MRKAVAAVLGILLALVLLTALLVTGFYLLVNAATLALAPLVGEPAAMAITGFACFLLLALVFYRLTQPARSDGKGQSAKAGSSSPIGVIRNLIRNNPLESALAAFALGVAEQSDPRLKSLLLQGGMALMKEANAEAGEGGSSSNDEAPADEEPLAKAEPSVDQGSA